MYFHMFPNGQKSELFKPNSIKRRLDVIGMVETGVSISDLLVFSFLPKFPSTLFSGQESAHSFKKERQVDPGLVGAPGRLSPPTWQHGRGTCGARKKHTPRATAGI